jgi:hypothetical protein
MLVMASRRRVDVERVKVSADIDARLIEDIERLRRAGVVLSRADAVERALRMFVDIHRDRLDGGAA